MSGVKRKPARCVMEGCGTDGAGVAGVGWLESGAA